MTWWEGGAGSQCREKLRAVTEIKKKTSWDGQEQPGSQTQLGEAPSEGLGSWVSPEAPESMLRVPFQGGWVLIRPSPVAALGSKGSPMVGKQQQAGLHHGSTSS